MAPVKQKRSKGRSNPEVVQTSEHKTAPAEAMQSTAKKSAAASGDKITEGSVIACPQHVGGEITIERDGERLVGICRCIARFNPWRDQVVWERFVGKKTKEPAQNPAE